MKNQQIIPLVQGLYFVITGVWPLVHIESFLYVTGPKIDIWLVKTVGILILPYSFLCFYVAAKMKKSSLIALVNSTCCLGLAIIDLYYYLKGVISWVYMVDFVLQFTFFTYWILYLFYFKKQ